jgi:hypothetical protein
MASATPDVLTGEQSQIFPGVCSLICGNAHNRFMTSRAHTNPHPPPVPHFNPNAKYPTPSPFFSHAYEDKEGYVNKTQNDLRKQTTYVQGKALNQRTSVFAESRGAQA